MSCKLYNFQELRRFSDKTFLIYRENPNEEKVYTYDKIVRVSQDFSDFLVKFGIEKTRVSIQCPHSPELCVILLSVLNCDCSFCPISYDVGHDVSLDAIWKLKSSFFISYINFDCLNDKLKLVESKIIIDTEFYVYQICMSQNDDKEGKSLNECYSIKTSGSTGDGKIVRVPYQCIEPNIIGLSLSLGITCKDVIFLSSPITFDPFVVEFFLAMKNGAALLITNNETRRAPNKLAEVLQPKNLRGVTFIQTTPSLFRIFGLNIIQTNILRYNTSIRLLLLGGERFPLIKEIKQWTAENCFSTRIFNIYGITEVSCWSTLHEVRQLQPETRIPIGIPIDLGTHIRVVNDKNESILEGLGEIQIGSASRKCLIDDETHSDKSNCNLLFRATGDVGYISEGKICYEGRKTEVIKRFGHRVHLGHIRETLQKIEGVINVESCFDDEDMRLIIFVRKKRERTDILIQNEILAKLRNFEKPDEIMFVDHFPLTAHGKVSKKKLIHLYACEKKDTPINVFQKFITSVLSLDMSGYRSAEFKQEIDPLEVSFLDAGGTSFQALSLSANVENFLRRPVPTLLEMMLNGKITLSTIFNYIRNISPEPFRGNNGALSFKSSNRKTLLIKTWEYDTGKCVDATPTCHRQVVCVGSHSKLLVALDTETGQEISTCILPDRIECQVSFVNDQFILVGCYDGYMYVIDYLTGKIEWKFDCGGMVKARPLQIGNMAVIGTYSKSGNLLCLKLNEKMAEWKTQIGSKGIFASPLKIDEKTFLVCSLGGEVACLIFTTGRVVWETKYESPVFSTPAILGRNAAVVAEVNGFVHCLNLDSGSEKIEGVINVESCFDDEDMRLIIFVRKKRERTDILIQNEILAKLRNFEKPDEIMFVDHFPLTAHGKVSKKKLIHLYACEKKDTPINVFQKFITSVLSLDMSGYRSAEFKQEIDPLEVSFLDAGGTSFQALSLSANIENFLRRPVPTLLEMMLNGKITLSTIFNYIRNISPEPFRGNNGALSFKSSNRKTLLIKTWEYDTGKCVDATPTCHRQVVCVGSHSKLLVALDTETGQEISTCILPDRIECQVSFVNDQFILVGCYDGYMYVIDYLTGKIVWKFDCGGMVKARPLQIGNMAVIGTYSKSGNLLCLKLNEKMAEWKTQIGSKGIFASPLKIDEKTFLVCSLGGEVACLIFTTGRVVWETKYESPVFSTPAILGRNAAVVAEVNGFVHCLNLDSGSEIWSYRTDGNIFSSLKVCDISDETFIIFGNHDHNIYCLKSVQVSQNTSIKWKCELDSAVYSTPQIFSIHTDLLAVLSCSTKGSIYILDFLAGSILFTMNLDNEIFSTPCIVRNKVFVGCRNNNVVCLQLRIEQ